MILCFDDYAEQAGELADALAMPCKLVDRHRFPDGEVKLTLPVALPAQVIIYRSLDHPNEKLVELLLAARAAREQGVKELILVAPYLCYMRQDIAFNPGEVVSQRIIGRFIADLFDTVLTVDPHLHRVHHLKQAVPAKRALALQATPAMAAFLRTHASNPILLGPDSESEQWVKAVAEPDGLRYATCTKQRLGDREVSITLPDIDFRDQSVVLLDDIISSGETIARAAVACREQGVASVDVLVTHALFAPGAESLLKDAGVRHVWSTNSVRHKTNAVSLVALLGDALRSWLH
ncbi:ribose-phosphate pyrophosphokinase [Thiogranum longum]|uniref:Ribose-phosphate pyrophosphokinase n=1 Tax=Thiogranum longum TaxID=1537524 RepID=A0A4R1HN77_9GAMM|nr:ribose-phosphate diphosphokinase [Thiogranum longum]TCK18712.1 ribose-phosphate pyrophosphokinase [Thiogranum longum]